MEGNKILSPEELRPAPRQALVPFAPARLRADCNALHRPAAPFLAHLIATAQQVPQTRAKRRAESEQANSAYAAAVSGPMPSFRRVA